MLSYSKSTSASTIRDNTHRQKKALGQIEVKLFANWRAHSIGGVKQIISLFPEQNMDGKVTTLAGSLISY